MWTPTTISVLVVTLLGIYGCAPAVSRSVRSHEIFKEPTSPAPDPVGASPSPDIPVLGRAPTASIQRQAEEAEKIGLRASPDDAASGLTRGTLIQEKSPPALLPREQGTLAAEKTAGDEQLLNPLEQALNKTIAQPAQRRPLHFSRAVIDHPRVRYFIREFSRNQKDYFAKTLARSGRYVPMIASVFRDEGLPEELAYLALVESNFHPPAVSPSGAAGLWQLVPDTARRYGLKINAWVDERRDPVKSTRAAAAYLKDLHDRYDRWYLATAAYNAGEGTIDKALQTSGAKDFWTLSAKARLREETRNFVPRFVAATLIGTDPNKYGFENLVYDPPLEYEEVEVSGNLSLAALAELAGCALETMQSLNLELVRHRTPPGQMPVRVKLPAGRAAGFLSAYYERRNARPVEIVTHEVKKGETLYSIARRYGQEVRSLIELNGLTTRRLRIGQKLQVIFEGLRGRLR